MADNDETLDPVTIGDLILLNATEPKEYVGGLRGDTASFTTGIQLPNFSQKRDELQFDDYVFRVCPALNYRQRNELDIHEMKTSGISSSKSSSGKSDGPKTLQRKMSTRDQEANAAALSLLHKRVEVEAAQNAAVIT